MTRLVLMLLSLIITSGCISGQVRQVGQTRTFASVDSAPTAFPDKIDLKTRTETFTSKFYFLLRDGKIWTKPYMKIEDYKRIPIPDGKWSLFNGTGLPGPDYTPDRVVEISADGENLIAISDENYIYYTKIDPIKWWDKWGKPGKRLQLPPNKGWSISHRSALEAGGYEDIGGNFIPTGTGVTCLYVLSSDGTSLRFGDPWILPGFDHHVGLPLKGRFVAEALSASGSTMFVINSAGRMFTRLADFDTIGSNPMDFAPFNPFLSKDQQPKKKLNGGLRTLPGEDWREQPPVFDSFPDAKITTSITIFQNGKGNSGDGRGFGNAGRELRVEGTLGDKGGYFSKQIFDNAWTFVEAKPAADVSGPLLTGEHYRQQTPGPSITKSYSGKFSFQEFNSIAVQLLGFSPFTDTAILKIGEYEAFIYYREGYFGNPDDSDTIVMKANVQLPPQIFDTRNRTIRDIIRQYFSNKSESDTFRIRIDKKTGLVKFVFTEDLVTRDPVDIEFTASGQ